MASYIVNAEFKGLVDYDSPNAMAVVSGATTLPDGSNRQLSHPEYLEAVRLCAKECPELAQTLARSIGAAIVALEMQAHGHKVMLVSVEGCVHHVPPYKPLGRDIVSTIWARIVRPYHALPPQRTVGDSCCTVEESRQVVDLALQGPATEQKFVQCVSHAYHAPRVDLTLREAVAQRRAEGLVTVLPTLTPEQAADSARRVPGLEPLREIIAAAALPEKVLRWERRGEALTRLLHSVSNLGERLTGKSLERWLAAGRRTSLA